MNVSIYVYKYIKIVIFEVSFYISLRTKDSTTCHSVGQPVDLYAYEHTTIELGRDVGCG